MCVSIVFSLLPQVGE